MLNVDPAATSGDLINIAEIVGSEDTDGKDRTSEDADSTADTTSGNDAGGTPGEASDNHIDDDGVDTDGDGITDEDDHDPALVTVVAPNPAIDIEKDTNGVQSDEAPGETITEGDPITWTYVVTNTGNTALQDAIVTDVDSAGHTLTVTCESGTSIIPFLLPGESATCTSTGTAATGPYANNATVTGNPVLPDFTDPGVDPRDPTTWPTDPTVYTTPTGPNGQPAAPVTDEDPSHYTGGSKLGTFDLSLTKTLAPNTDTLVQIRDTVTYILTVTNEGDIEAINIEVTDTLPEGTILNDPDWTATGNNGATHTIAGPLAPGQTNKIEITVTITQAGELTNTAEITAATPSQNGEALEETVTDLDSTPANTSGTEDDEDTANLTVQAQQKLAITGTTTTTLILLATTLLLAGTTTLHTRRRKTKPTTQTS